MTSLSYEELVQRHTRHPGLSEREAKALFYKHPNCWVLVATLLVAIGWRGALFLAGLAPGLLEWIIVLALATTWGLEEWVIHTFLLHGWLPGWHKMHHRKTREVRFFFTPIHLAVIVPVWLGLWLLALPLPAWLTFVIAWGLLAFRYERAHAAFHSGWMPEDLTERRQHHRHLLHHHGLAHKLFGVTSSTGDTLFRTREEDEVVKGTAPLTQIGRGLRGWWRAW